MNGALVVMPGEAIGEAFAESLPGLRCLWADIRCSVARAAGMARVEGRSFLIAEFLVQPNAHAAAHRQYQIIKPDTPAASILKACGGDMLPRVLKITPHAEVVKAAMVWKPDDALEVLRVNGSGTIIIH
jgi:hypothetical protein